MLIEVNPRHWDQHQLGTLVGVNLTWIAYQKAIGGNPEPRAPRYEAQRVPRWIAERETVFLVARSALAKVGERSRSAKNRFSLLQVAVMTLTEMNQLLRRPFIFPILSSADPVPGILFCSRLIRELFVLARHARHNKA